MTLNLTGPSKIYKLFMAKCPVHVVPLVGVDQYHHLDLKSMNPISLTANKSASQSPSVNQVNTRKFSTQRTYILFNGSDKLQLDDKILLEKKDAILSLAADSLGLACFELAKVIAKTPVKPLSSVDELYQSLYNLSIDTDDVGIIAKPQKLQALKQGILKDKISFFQTGKLKTKNCIDFTYPIFAPNVFDEEIIVYNLQDSFVIADPVSFFITESHQLAVDIKIDLQSNNSIEMFKL